MPNNIWLATVQSLSVAVALSLSAQTSATEIKVFVAIPFAPMLETLASDFDNVSGHKLIISAAAGGALVKRVDSGEAFDLAILLSTDIELLEKSGKVDPSGPTQNLQPFVCFRGQYGHQPSDCRRSRFVSTGPSHGTDLRLE
jgi:ABC-type molybdate transport system substrate-binding protein